MVIQERDVVYNKKLQPIKPQTAMKQEEPVVIINLSLTSYSQALPTETTNNSSPTINADQVGAQFATIKPIEPAKQTSQPVSQLLRCSKQTTKGTFLSQVMLGQEKEVQHVEVFGDEFCLY